VQFIADASLRQLNWMPRFKPCVASYMVVYRNPAGEGRDRVLSPFQVWKEVSVRIEDSNGFRRSIVPSTAALRPEPLTPPGSQTIGLRPLMTTRSHGPSADTLRAGARPRRSHRSSTSANTPTAWKFRRCPRQRAASRRGTAPLTPAYPEVNVLPGTAPRTWARHSASITSEFYVEQQRLTPGEFTSGAEAEREGFLKRWKSPV
jgi:hypothetical protein